MLALLVGIVITGIQYKTFSQPYMPLKMQFWEFP
jgi:hypothetical protein